jgi:hypothetical protein
VARAGRTGQQSDSIEDRELYEPRRLKGSSRHDEIRNLFETGGSFNPCRWNMII